ncbi:MAG: hypothetical protein E7661_06645 [Ruminococcaceae bacterium]|nr:hypothetical protein [Oscillospiraceae bacterium]
MKKAYFIPRAIICFLIFVCLGLAFVRFASHHYANVAEWKDPASRDVLIYDEDAFYLAGEIGKNGLNEKDYPTEKVLGEVTPEGLFQKQDPVVIWMVENKKDFIIVVDEEDSRWLYYREGEENPAETEAATQA